MIAGYLKGPDGRRFQCLVTGDVEIFINDRVVTKGSTFSFCDSDVITWSDSRLHVNTKYEEYEIRGPVGDGSVLGVVVEFDEAQP